MPKNSKPAPAIRWKGRSVADPRIAMRVLLGALLLGNLVAAAIAFKSFGGSADGRSKDHATLRTQLRLAKARLESTRQHVAKIEIARTEGDDFMAKYFMVQRTLPETTVAEMTKSGAAAGVRILPETYSNEPIEGSDTLEMVSITAPFEGTYSGLTKLVNLLEKSPKFFIIDSINLTAPQQQNGKQDAAQNLNVMVRLLTF